MTQHAAEDQTKEFQLYTKVWGGLLFLTVVTVWVSYYDFGTTGDVVLGMAIATVKASMVAWFFMHLAHEDGVTWTYAIYPFVLLAILMVSVLTDDFIREDTSFMQVDTNLPDEYEVYYLNKDKH